MREPPSLCPGLSRSLFRFARRRRSFCFCCTLSSALALAFAAAAQFPHPRLNLVHKTKMVVVADDRN